MSEGQGIVASRAGPSMDVPVAARRLSPEPLAGSPVRLSSLLRATAEVARELACDRPLDDKVARALETARATLGVAWAGIWLHGASALSRAWTVGDAPDLAGEELEHLFGADPDRRPDFDAAVLPLASGPARIGLLALDGAMRLGEAERLFAGIVADLLGPELSHTAHSHQLEAEVEVRTRQIDDERRFTQTIIDSLPLGLYVVDREYRIQLWNRKRETGMQGVAREAAVGRPIFEVLHRQPADTLRREFDDVFRTGRVQVFHMESEASGEHRTFRISKIPMRVADGAVTHVITLGEDVTDWKEAQDRFAHGEKLAALGQLAAGVMHEINNPLATIAACAESLELRIADAGTVAGPMAPDSAEFLRIIEQEVHRCKRIVDGLLDFSRPKPATKDPTQVNAVVDQTLFLLKHHVRFKRLRVEALLDPGLPLVIASPEQLVQVFMALLLNALDAMNDAGTITVRTRPGRTSAEAVIVEIVDQGHGIPRSETSKIFEPFYTTKGPGRGTGLGLSICYGIIQDHGGQIEVDSTPGVGSTFRVLLPAAEVA